MRIISLFLLVVPLQVFSQRMPEENYLRGLAYYQKEMYDSALVSFTISKGMDEKNAMAWYHAGMSKYMLDNNREALADFEQAEKLQPGMAALMLAKTYARLNMLEKTLEYLDIHLRSVYKEAESTILLDKDLRKFENRKEWISFWKNNQYYTTLDQMLAEARYYAKKEENLEAIEILSEGLKRGFRGSLLYGTRAGIYMKLDEYNLALKDLDDALEKDRRNAGLYKMRAEVNFKLGNYHQAVDDYSEAIRYNPEDFENYPARALALSKADRLEEAKEDMLYYLGFFPEDDEGWYHYGVIHMEAGKYLDALRSLNRALEINKTDARYYLARGESYYHARTYRYASNDLSMTLDLDPRNSEAYYLKGLSAVKLGEYDAACFNFEKAFQYGKKEAFNEMGKYCK